MLKKWEKREIRLTLWTNAIGEIESTDLINGDEERDTMQDYHLDAREAYAKSVVDRIASHADRRARLKELGG